MDVLKQLKQFYWKDRYLLFVSMICLICSTALGLVYPLLLRYLIDDVIRKEQFQWVPYLALLVVGVVAVKALFAYTHGYTGGRLGNRVAFSMRNALYEKLQYLSFQYYDRAKTGDLMSRLTADLEGIRQFIGFGFAQLLNVFLMFILGSIMMFSMNWKLTLVTFVTMPFLVITALRLERKIHPEFRSIRQANSDLTTAVQENINGVRTVKSFAREPYEVEKFAVRNGQFRASNINLSYTWSKFFPMLELLSSVCVAILLTTGGMFVINGSMSLGELVAFFSFIWYIIAPMRDIGFHINNYTQSKASGERVLEILNQYVHVKDKDEAVALQPDQVKGTIRFEHVTFAYPEKQPALTDLNIEAPAGSVIGLLGGTGSGKSTVIQLLLRAYNIKEGRITLDGKDIRDIKLESLRQQIALVFQETFLFSSTIRNNISYGRKDVTDEEIVRAAKLAKAHDFIMELPLGYDTVVGERGMGLSGGQKQRIAIARALIKNPKILIMDDATSAVDMETEHEIQAGFKELMKGRTTFIIAHRISSLKHADEILVLEGGRVIQRGTHEQLLRQSGHYLETYKIQYSDHPDFAEHKEERRVAN
ncbi:ABC transporter ATP-binding protein [Paenibacillus hodogayensis]|uniref:ABC transporter ATP-binding protein n=1 Tax=Paenibacillus hodogayensis TaxID=279208 RepID=A0ABV5W4F7_9BACL